MDVDFGLAHERVSPASVQRVAYEDLVAQPERVVREVCAFCNLEFDPGMLATPEVRDSEYSDFYAQIHANVDRPATQEFVDRWAQDLSPEEIAWIERVAGDRMIELGYAPESSAPPRLPSGWQIRRDRIGRMIEQTAHYVRRRPRYLAFLLYRKARLGLLKSFLWSVNY